MLNTIYNIMTEIEHYQCAYMLNLTEAIYSLKTNRFELSIKEATILKISAYFSKFHVPKIIILSSFFLLLRASMVASMWVCCGAQ